MSDSMAIIESALSLVWPVNQWFFTRFRTEKQRSPLQFVTAVLNQKRYITLYYIVFGLTLFLTKPLRWEMCFQVLVIDKMENRLEQLPDLRMTLIRLHPQRRQMVHFFSFAPHNMLGPLIFCTLGLSGKFGTGKEACHLKN